MNRGQRGIALISVLLVMSLALLITAGLLRSHRLLLQSSGQQLQQMHLRQLGMAGETWGLLMLEEAPPETIDLTQDWARLAPGFDVDDAQVSVEIEDLGGRFNLNALLNQGQVDAIILTRWARLQALLGLPPLTLDQVGVLRELSQLRLLPGVDAHRLALLEPWVAVLPVEAALNINTAPPLVLRMLDGVEGATVDALVRQRETKGWDSVQAFTQDPLLSGAGISGHGLSVNSRWFRITVQVSLGQSGLRLASDVERDPETRQLNIVQRRLLPSITREMPR